LDYAEQSEKLQESSNPFAMVVLAHLRTLQTRQDQGERYGSKIRLIKGLYERGWAADDVRRLFRVIDWMMDLPKPLEVTFWQQIKQYEEEKQMPFMTTPERIGREEGLAEGLAKGRTEGLTEGLTKGRTEGLTEGLTKGRTEGLAKGIEVALELKFGEAGLGLMPEIRAIEDEAKLETVLRAVHTAAGPEDLRRLWTG
jgi:tetrahydromethanopterin S-methyltransferase subunit F